MKQFKAESKRLLDLMINSIYTNKEIFLRELISNCSDAIDKLHFKSLTDSSVNSDFKIEIKPDKAARTLTISDNGVGMTKEDLETNLGTIANSGTLKFKAENKMDENNMIGQFGVGFYSAFMVADCVTVLSKAYGTEEAHLWTSRGADGYEITPAVKDACGTVITLHLKDNDDDCKYDEFLEEYELKNLIKKYSDYIRYPIEMETTHSRKKADDDKEYETYLEAETLNSMVPIWKKPKTQVKKKDYNEFYKNKFHDYQDPLKVISANIEGNITYSALLFVPSHAPFDYYTKEYEKGLQLYSNGVLIMDKCGDLLPDCFGFIKGVVDSSDLSLNISREMLQKDRQLRAIAVSLEKKIVSELEKMLKNDRENYDKMFREYGKSIKFGAYDGFGVKKDLLKELIELYSSTEKKLATLKEYVGRMKEGQQFIYYACGESNGKIEKLPQTELVRDKGYEIFYLTDTVDEFVLKVIDEYEGKKFKNVSAKDIGLESEAEKEEVKKATEDNKELFDFMSAALQGKVKCVRLSSRMKSNAVCLTADGELSLEMEKVLNSMPAGEKVKADRVLEINANHPIFDKLKELFAGDKDRLTDYTAVLYAEAQLLEGISIEDPADFAEKLTKLLS